MVLDTHTRDFYDAVHERWNGSRAANRFPHLAFVSVGGGERDIQVRSGLTKSAEADVNVITTDAAGIWVSTDHRCIVWCKQLVLSLKRALFDVVGENFACREFGQIQKILHMQSEKSQVRLFLGFFTADSQTDDG